MRCSSDLQPIAGDQWDRRPSGRVSTGGLRASGAGLRWARGQSLASELPGSAQPSGPQPRVSRHTAKRRGVDAARPWPAVEWKDQQRGFLLAFSSRRHGRVETYAGVGPAFPCKKAQGMKPCAGLPPPSEGGALSGSAPAVCYAVWKAAISTAADLRLTLAAAGMLAS